MPTLIYLPYSPWSEKALWALEHHQVAHEREVHVPLAGELALRLKTRKLRGRVSVPVLVEPGRVLTDSFEIAQYAEHHGSGTPLFPEAHAAEIGRWNRRSEDALAAGRKVALQRSLAIPQALEEGLEPMLPPSLRAPLRFVARGGIAFMHRKYQTARADDSALTGALDALRAALGSNDYLLGGALSYADLAMAVVLQFVNPVSDAYIKLGLGTRQAMIDPELVLRYLDLIEWRDALYARHRHPAA
jgi:glutathione S-transferase